MHVFSPLVLSMASAALWQRFQQYFLRYDELGFSIKAAAHLLEHLAANDARTTVSAGEQPAEDRFSIAP